MAKAVKENKVVRLSDTIDLIIGHNPLFSALHSTNGLRIRDEVNVILDTGSGDAALQQFVDSTDIVINSHYHGDHTSSNRLFVDKAEFWVPAYSAEIFRDPLAGEKYSGADLVNEERPKRNPDEVLRIHPARELRDGDVLDFGKTKLHVILAPGHAMDHLIFYEEKEGILFSTDIDLAPFGPWYGNPHSSMKKFVQDIERIKEIGPRILVTSHMPEVYTDNLEERLDVYLSKIDKRDERILKILQENGPCTFEQIMEGRPVFRMHAPPVALNRLFDKIMITHHLERLIERGQIVKEGDLYRLA